MGTLRVTKKTSILTTNQDYSHKVAAYSMKHGGQKQDNNSVTVTVYTSDNCAFCEPAIDVVKQAIDDLSAIGCTPQLKISRIEQMTPINDYSQISAIPTIAVGRYQIVGLPRVEEVEHLLHRVIMESDLKH